MNPLLAELVRQGVITQADAEAIAAAMLDAGESDDAGAFAQYEITEQDIRAAIAAWDELMPEHRGLLDAELVDGEPDAPEGD